MFFTNINQPNRSLSKRYSFANLTDFPVHNPPSTKNPAKLAHNIFSTSLRYKEHENITKQKIKANKNYLRLYADESVLCSNIETLQKLKKYLMMAMKISVTGLLIIT